MKMQRAKRTKSSIFSIAQTILANIAIQGSNICCGVLTARTLAPSGRGTLAAVIMWPQLLAYALTLGTPLAYIYHVKKHPELSRQLSGASIVLSVAAGLVGSLFGYFVIPFSLRTYPSSDIHLAQMFVFLAPTGLCAITLMAQVQSAGSFGKYNLFRVLSPVSVLIGIGALRVTGRLNVHNAALVYLLGVLPALLWLVYLVIEIQKPTFVQIWSPIKLLLHYGLRAWGADLLGTVASQVDRVFVVQMLSPSSMGLYVIAQSAAGVLGVIPNAINPVILPKLAGRSVPDIVAATGRAVRLTMLLMLLGAVPLGLFGGFLLRFVYGDKFSGAAAILPFLLVEAVVDGMTSVLSQAFLAAGLPGIVTFLQGCGVLSAIPLIWVLVPRWGVRGAACALMLATCTRFTFILLNFPFRLKVRPPQLIIRRSEVLEFLRTRQFATVVQDT